jgi:hypothetical protein
LDDAVALGRVLLDSERLDQLFDQFKVDVSQGTMAAPPMPLMTSPPTRVPTSRPTAGPVEVPVVEPLGHGPAIINTWVGGQSGGLTTPDL